MRWDYPPIHSYITAYCECGCGEQFKTEIIKGKRNKRFVNGHNVHVNHPMHVPENVQRWAEANKRREIRICKNNDCNKEFEVLRSWDNEYCSRKCSNQDREGNLHKPDCGCTFCTPLEFHREDCLCVACRALRGELRGENSYNWQGGISFNPYPENWTEQLREYIRNRDYQTCQNCGKTKEQEERNLCVHHIDYDKENLDENNLITLCLSCHIKTNYSREYWEEMFKELMNEKFQAIV